MEVKDTCLEQLTRQARSKKGEYPLYRAFKTLDRVPLYEKFAADWLRRVVRNLGTVDNPESYFTRFIYLWITYNSWLTLTAPDDSKNDRDQYLIDAIAASEVHSDRFERLLGHEEEFEKNCKEFSSLGPVFSSVWLKKIGLRPWEEGEDRSFFLRDVKKKITGKKFKHVPYSPCCAFDHDLGGVPCDWKHVIHMIYQVRCNLFHGGKSSSQYRDVKFVTLAFKILWSMFKEEAFVNQFLSRRESRKKRSSTVQKRRS